MKTLAGFIFVLFLAYHAPVVNGQNPADSRNDSHCVPTLKPLLNDIIRFQGELQDAIAKGDPVCVARAVKEYGVANPPTKLGRPRDIPVIYAVICGIPEVLRQILQVNPDTEIRDNGFGLTPVLWASTLVSNPPDSFEKNMALIDILLAAGADIDARDGKGDSAVISNAILGRSDYIDALLSRGANINAKNHDGATALMLSRDDERVLKSLQMTNVFIRDKKGRTAAFYAIERCEPNKLQSIIRKDKSVLSIPDQTEETPMEFASRLNVKRSCPAVDAVLENARKDDVSLKIAFR